jgi:hypothetical protein
MMGAFFWVAVAVLAYSEIGWITGRIKTHQSYGLDAIGEGMISINATRHGAHLWAVWFAALCAMSAHAWWNGGGGDDTRRRLRSLRRVFRGVRRTAPAAGGAS